MSVQSMWRSCRGSYTSPSTHVRSSPHRNPRRFQTSADQGPRRFYGADLSSYGESFYNRRCKPIYSTLEVTRADLLYYWCRTEGSVNGEPPGTAGVPPANRQGKGAM